MIHKLFPVLGDIGIVMLIISFILFLYEPIRSFSVFLFIIGTLAFAVDMIAMEIEPKRKQKEKDANDEKDIEISGACLVPEVYKLSHHFMVKLELIEKIGDDKIHINVTAINKSLKGALTNFKSKLKGKKKDLKKIIDYAKTSNKDIKPINGSIIWL